LWWYTYIDEDVKMAHLFKKSVNAGRAFASTLVAAVPLVLLSLRDDDPTFGVRLVISVLLSLVMMVVGGRYFEGKLGGVAGDCLGALNQFVELGVLLVFAFQPPK
jgi:cobalamin synthase